jgi:TetR/AcrR family transcriptional repressor of mexJK operon
MKSEKTKPQVKKQVEKSVAGRPKDAAKREGIVRAANILFMKNGYSLTSMEAVARNASVSKLTIYSHFANKDELFKEVIRKRCEGLATAESFMALAKEPVEEALLRLGLNFTLLVFTPDSIRLHRIMQAEAVRHPKVVRIFYETGPKHVRSEFARLLQAWQEQKQLNIPDPAKASDQFFSLLKGEMLVQVTLLGMPMPNEAELKKHVRATVDFFLSAYSPTYKTKK